MNIDVATIRELILHARAYDGKEEVTDSSGDVDSAEDVDLMRSTARDPLREEMKDMIGGLDEDAKAELVALYWIGRGDYEGREFAAVVAHAKARKTTPTASYLLGVPLLGDHLDAGLEAVITAGVGDV